MKNLTPSEFRDILDELKIVHRKSSDNSFSLVLRADEDFDEDVTVTFSIEERRIQFWGISPGYGEGMSRFDRMEFCNAWNIEHCLPKAFVDGDEDFVVEWTVFDDEEVSREYLTENFVRLGLSAIWSFFKELRASSSTL